LGLKGGISIDVGSGPLRYVFCCGGVFHQPDRLALAILSYGSSFFSSTISHLFMTNFIEKNLFFSVVLAILRIGKMIKEGFVYKT